MDCRNDAEASLIDAVIKSTTPDGLPPTLYFDINDLVKLGHTEETIDALVVAGVLVRWKPLGKPESVTFTPWGAWQAGVVVRERYHIQRKTRWNPNRPGKPPVEHAREAIVIPGWIRSGRDHVGDPVLHWSVQFELSACLPLADLPQAVLDQLIAHQLGPLEFLACLDSGELTADE